MPFMSISSEFSLARSFALLAVLKRVEAFVLRHVDDANFPDVVEPNWSTKQDLGEHDVSIEDSARLATDSEDEPRRNIIVVSILCYSVVKMGILYPIAVNFRFFVYPIAVFHKCSVLFSSWVFVGCTTQKRSTIIIQRSLSL